MKKRKTHLSRIVGIGLLLGGCFPAGALAQDYLNVYTIGGSGDTSISIDDIRKITFDDSQVSVWYDEQNSDVLPYAMLWKVTFSDSQVAIDEITAGEGIQIVYRDRQVEVTSSSSIESLVVYNMQGRLVWQLSPRSEHVSVALDDLPAGVYIVRAKNSETQKTQKIIKY